MADASSFSPDYTAARARFRSSSMPLGATLETHPIGQRGPDGEELGIDVAMLGDPAADKVVIVSSGLHGIEGFFGSAVQAAILEERLVGFRPPRGHAIVLLHALNPYGFAWLRRVNEDNVDLNRNFLLAGESYAGAPERYAMLDPLLNPQSAPTSVEPFLLKAGWNIAKYGMPALREAVAGGQYEFPAGLFFGGRGPSRTQAILGELLPRLLPRASRVLHVDLHTGLGPWTTYKLLVDHEAGSEGANWLAERFGADHVQPWANTGVSYRIRGGLGTWCKALFPGRSYDVMVAEFGTYANLRVIRALRGENQAHHWGKADDPSTKRAKDGLREVFAPSDRHWRDAVVPQGVAIVDRAMEAAFT
jgi:hypothetical protein